MHCPELPPHGSGAGTWHTAAAAQILMSCTKNPAATALQRAHGHALRRCAQEGPSRPATQHAAHHPALLQASTGQARALPHSHFLLPLRLPPKHRHSAEDCPPPSSPVGLPSQSSASLPAPNPAPIATSSGAPSPQLHSAEKAQCPWSPSCKRLPVLSPLPCSCHSDWPASPTTLCLPRGCLLCSPCSRQLKLPCHLP